MAKKSNIQTLASAGHEWLTRKALLPASHFQRHLIASRRPTVRAFDDSMSFRRRARRWNSDERLSWLIDRLRHTVRRAYETTDYYRTLLRTVRFDPYQDFDFDDYARLPVLERSELQRVGKELVARNVPQDQLQRDTTGGSTGTPSEIWLGPQERGWRDAAKADFLERIGAPQGMAAANFWGHHLDPVANNSLRERFYNFAHNERWFDCFRQSAEVFEHFHRQFEQWRPVRINAYASALGYFAEFIAERGYKPDYPTRCFETGAEKLLPHHRKIIEQVFGRPVHERYGSRDAGHIAFQLRPSETLDFETDWCNILIEPETCQSEADILVTKLHADGMPMLRYRIGDIGRFPAGSKPGHPAFILHQVIGRQTDRLWLPDGRWLSGLQLPHLLKDYPVREFMFRQSADYSVQLSIVPKHGLSEQITRALLSTLRSNLPGLTIDLSLVDRVPRTKANKWRPVTTDVAPAKSNDGVRI